MVLDLFDPLLGELHQRDIGRHGDCPPCDLTLLARCYRAFTSGEYAVLEVVDDLVRGPRALLRASFDEALEVDGAMLAGAMALSGGRVLLPRLLVATDLLVLGDLPVGGR